MPETYKCYSFIKHKLRILNRSKELSPHPRQRRKKISSIIRIKFIVLINLIGVGT